MGLSPELQNGLAFYYVGVAILNAGFAAYYFFGPKNVAKAALWSLVTLLFLVHAGAYFAHLGWVLPQNARDAVDKIIGPVVYTSASVALFALMLIFRRFFTNPQVGLALLNLTLLAGGWAMTDPYFREIVTKADNVPITMLMFSVGFCTWLALHRAVQNDERIARGEPTLEKEEDDKVLVWPDLVYTELIAMVVCTFVLVIWAVLLKAPLEQPATSAKAPNPSKAPWYFLGLQEMLVYFDPWMAGVVLPTMIIVGLMALPFIDFNREGNGYFSFKRRWFAVTTFMFGFLVLWVTLIVLGTFLRGPNWNFFGPFEYWDPHKVDPLNNVNVSDIFWLRMLKTSPTEVRFPLGGGSIRLLNAVWREMPGIIIVLVYLLALPPLLARTVMRLFFMRMGFARFIVLVTLIQFMAALPLKMVLRWTMNLKYIVYIPEIFFNI
jgi:Cytochrome b(C-terminal)/b6/petD